MLRFMILLTNVVFTAVLLAVPPQITPQASSALRSMLNSERIAYFFGSYGIELFPSLPEPMQKLRLSNLHSGAGESKIMRTLGIVKFLDLTHPEIQKAHKLVLDGGSIGAVFKNHGFQVIKSSFCFIETKLSPVVMKMMKVDVALAAVYAYELRLAKPGEKEVPYAHMIEVYSPDFLDTRSLTELYTNEQKSLQGLLQTKEREKETQEFIQTVFSLMKF